MSGASVKVCAVVVTYNRLALLQECIEALRRQSRPVDQILVVNNGCTDGTADWLAAQSGLEVITQKNSGSSGGQYAGLKGGYARGGDWFWLMDDDTIPSEDALEKLLACADRLKQEQSLPVGWLCSTVLWTDGTPHQMNLPRLYERAPLWIGNVLARRCVRCEAGTFVSFLVSRQAVEECGLPLHGMFIWSDDIEFSLRISQRSYFGAVVLDSIALHKTAANAGAGIEHFHTRPKHYHYQFRNEVIVLRRREPNPARLAFKYAYYLLRKCALAVRAGVPSAIPAIVTCSVKGLLFNITPDPVTKP